MNATILALMSACIAVVVYTYAGYPLLLRLLVRLRGPKAVRRTRMTPRVSLIISAYNEQAVIRDKIENALALDYPREALEIIVVSDASTDATDTIVQEYARRSVRLERQPERRGKTGGLNAVVPTASGEIVVFSDANALYERGAIRALVRNFADPDVGCVTGEARYLPGHANAADRGERAYWDYEIQIKRLETAVGSMVGGDGAIYAIRRSLWRTLPETAINDFLNPLQIVAAGYRAVYEPEAICYEHTAGNVRAEYRRRVRIVSRSWRAVFQARGVLNPFRVGLFAWSLVSHKMLRWVSAAAVAIACVSGALMVAPMAARHVVAISVGLLAAGAAIITPAGRRIASTTVYFVVVSVASVVGVVKGSTGRVSGIWATPRDDSATVVSAGRVAAMLLIVVVAAAFAGAAWVGSRNVMEVVFWLAVGILLYVYAGYPAALFFVHRRASRLVQKAPIEPSVCILIAANDEEAVMTLKLEQALRVDYPRHLLDIVVASDGSVDRTNAIARSFAPRGVRLLEFQPRRGKIAAINAAMRHVTSEIVVFSDANALMEPGAIRTLVRSFADPRVGAVSGDVVLEGHRAALAQSEDLYYRYERWVQQAESAIGSMIGADGALYAIRRHLFQPPADDTILDDMAIPMAVIRAGYRVVFDPEARAHEQGSQTATQEFTRKSRVIAGAVQFVLRPDSGVPRRGHQVMLALVSHKILRWLSPLFATVAFVSSLALAPGSDAYLAAALVQSAVFVLGVAGCVPALRRITIVSVTHYFCLVQVAAFVGLLRGLTGRQSVLWERFARVAP